MKKINYVILACAILPAGSLFSEEMSTSKSYKLSPIPAVASIPAPSIVATVNGADITLERFWNALLANAGNAVLTSIADEILLDQEAEKAFGPLKGVKSPGKARKSIEAEVDLKISEFKKRFPDGKAFEAQLKTSKLTLEDLRQPARLEIYKVKLLGDKVKVTSAEIRKYFDDNKTKLATPENLRLKHILLSSEQEAKDLLLALKVGADFDLLAKEKSLDAASKDKGGDLGIFAMGMLAPEIEKKAFVLKNGESDIVKSDQGFHLIKVLERKPAKASVWDKDTQGIIEKFLTQAKLNQEYPKYIQELRAKADIKILLNK